MHYTLPDSENFHFSKWELPLKLISCLHGKNAFNKTYQFIMKRLEQANGMHMQEVQFRANLRGLFFLVLLKGQLISKGHFGVFKSIKN